jgi:hypothetical protein
MNLDGEESQESIPGYANDSSRVSEKRMMRPGKEAAQTARARHIRKK